MAFQNREDAWEEATRTYVHIEILLCLRHPCATMMRPTALLCVASLVPAVAGIALDEAPSGRPSPLARERAAAEATYGHISTWETGGDEHDAFVLRSIPACWCNSAAASFNGTSARGTPPGSQGWLHVQILGL